MNYKTEIWRSLRQIRDEFGIEGVVLDDEVVLNGEVSDQCGLLKVHDVKLLFTFGESFSFFSVTQGWQTHIFIVTSMNCLVGLKWIYCTKF